MKKEHENIIKTMYEDLKQIPGYISGCGAASATIESFISTARDLQEAHNYMIIILDNIFLNIEYEKILKKPDIDKADFQYAAEQSRKSYIDYSARLHEFINERKAQGWN